MTGPASRTWRLGDLDHTRPYGIPFDRNRCPEDDELTDLAAWLAARFDDLATERFELGTGLG